MSSTEEPVNIYTSHKERRISSPEGDTKHSSSSGEEEYYENATAQFKRQHKQGTSGMERLPPDVLERISKFLYPKSKTNNKLNLASISPSIRTGLRSIPVDLSNYPMGVEALGLFLKANKDLDVIGLSIEADDSKGSLEPLRKYMSNLKKLNIYGFEELNLSALLECKSLKHCKIYNLPGAIKYLTNCTRLKTLAIRGDLDINLKLNKLEKLEITYPENINIDVSQCKNLVELKIKLGGNVKKLKLNPNLGKLQLHDVEIVNYSFLEEASSLRSLSIEQDEKEILDLNYLRNLKSLNKLALSVEGIEGDFFNLTNLEHLKLDYKTMRAIPTLPAKLKWFELSRTGFRTTAPAQLLHLSSLELCTQIETILLTVKNTNLDLRDISSCTTVKNLNITCDRADNTDAMETLVNMVNLRLEIGDLDFYPELREYPLLDSLYIIDEDLQNLDFIEDCDQLTTLYVKSNALDFEGSVPPCPKLVNVKLERISMEYSYYLDEEDISYLEEGTVVPFIEKVYGHQTVMETPD